MRLFDVLGPVMIGPSSSHTAGAAKIGYTAQKLLGEVPAQADIGLYGSYATTGLTKAYIQKNDRRGHKGRAGWIFHSYASARNIAHCPIAVQFSASR